MCLLSLRCWRVSGEGVGETESRGTRLREGRKPPVTAPILLPASLRSAHESTSQRSAEDLGEHSIESFGIRQA